MTSISSVPALPFPGASTTAGDTSQEPSLLEVATALVVAVAAVWAIVVVIKAVIAAVAQLLAFGLFLLVLAALLR
jgi:hypothetical protein